MLILQNLTYTHPNKELLFDKLNLRVNHHDKIALVGNNGVGKTTLLRIVAGELHPSGGELSLQQRPYYLPQIFGQYNTLTVAEALQIDQKVKALREILGGQVTEENLNLLNDDWTIEERCQEALHYWELTDLDLNQALATLSGGQKTKVFLAGIMIHQPAFVLLDEPSNHLDLSGRRLLYDFIQNRSTTLLVVSHDRTLLNLLNTVYELTSRGVTVYGGNYEFYAAQKEIERNALYQDIQAREKELRSAKEKQRETLERKQKLDARGKRKQEKAGVAKIMMNTLRNSAENSTAKVKSVHAEKIEGIADNLQALRTTLPDIDKMKLVFDPKGLPKGKVLYKATAVNVVFYQQALWKEALDCEIRSGERIALKGENGSGKTTLLRLILGRVEQTTGCVYRADVPSLYIDQDYSLIDNFATVYEQAQAYNDSSLLEQEVKRRLSWFLFTKDHWDKPCSALSGGERMRLMLCCLNIQNSAPDLIVLDEPTNNLDIQNLEILASALKNYHGTLLVVSHDEYFLQQINIQREINL